MKNHRFVVYTDGMPYHFTYTWFGMNTRCDAGGIFTQWNPRLRNINTKISVYHYCFMNESR